MRCLSVCLSVCVVCSVHGVRERQHSVHVSHSLSLHWEVVKLWHEASDMLSTLLWKRHICQSVWSSATRTPGSLYLLIASVAGRYCTSDTLILSYFIRRRSVLHVRYSYTYLLRLSSVLQWLLTGHLLKGHDCYKPHWLVICAIRKHQLVCLSAVRTGLYQ